jgi:hypothetical protein
MVEKPWSLGLNRQDEGDSATLKSSSKIRLFDVHLDYKHFLSNANQCIFWDAQTEDLDAPK